MCALNPRKKTKALCHIKKLDACALAILGSRRCTSSSPQPVTKETDVLTGRRRGQAAMFHRRSPTLADILVNLIPLCPAVCLLRGAAVRGVL